jgi:Tetratricopeptide repeat
MHARKNAPSHEQHGDVMLHRSTLLPLFALAFFFPASAWSQIQGMSMPANSAPQDTQEPSAAFIQGSVIAENSILPAQVAIVMECGNRIYAEGYVDVNGEFHFQVGANLRQGMVPMAESSGLAVGPVPEQNPGWVGCSLHAQAPGYTSSRIMMAGLPSSGLLNVGRIVLHPYGQAGSGPAWGNGMVTITQINVPQNALQEFKKGVKEELDGRPRQAVVHLQRAIAHFPNYALAWAELGKVQQNLGQTVEACHSFQQAINADPSLIEAARGLAFIDVQARQWGALLDTTNRILQIYPSQYPEFWLLNSAAYFNLGRLYGAERSILRGIQLDSKHQIPQMEYLCGRVLGAEGQYQNAVMHIKNYLKLAPHAPDAGLAQHYVAEFQKLLVLAAEK